MRNSEAKKFISELQKVLNWKEKTVSRTAQDRGQNHDEIQNSSPNDSLLLPSLVCSSSSHLAAARASCSSVTSSGHNIFFRQIEAVRGICRFLADSGKYGVMFSHPGMRRKLQKSGVIL